MIHVFIGTKAQYIKMAPLLRRMDSERVAYRLIDSGQHGDLTAALRRELGLREPDFRLGGDRDVVSVPQAVGWSLGLAGRLVSRPRLRRRVFGGRDGVCVVHGDTPSALLGALLAKRAGLDVAHVEAGLRTFRWLHPFPEEIVRVVVGRISDVLFAPGPEAAANLRKTAVKGRIVEQPTNTVLESVRDALGADDQSEARDQPRAREQLDVNEQSEARDQPRAREQMDADDRPGAHEQPRAREQMDADDRPGAHEQPTGRAGAGARGDSSGSVVVTMHRVENLHRRSRREALVDVVERLAADWPVRWVVHGPTERALAGEARNRLSDAGVELVPLMAYGEFLAGLASRPLRH